MPQGLQVWDAAGNLIVDTSSSLGRVLGVATIDGGDTAVITDPNYTTTSRPFWTVLPLGATGAPNALNYDVPRVDWAPLASPSPGLSYSPGYSTTGKSFKIIYGVF